MPPIRRVRQHVNPLSNKYSTPATAPNWGEVYTNPQLPLHLDVGCAKGDFVRDMGRQVSGWNFLGLEIRAGALQCGSSPSPAPWLKKRHQKRRVVQPELVAVLAELMPEGGMVWLQSDIEAVCVEMCDRFDENSNFERDGSTWLSQSPFPAKTDRERVGEEKGLPVFRARYRLVANGKS